MNNKVIIGFFKELRVSESENYYLRFSSESNNRIDIYVNHKYEDKRKNLAMFFMDNKVKNIQELDHMTNLIDNWLFSCLSDYRLFKIVDNDKNLFENKSIQDINIFCKNFENEIREIIKSGYKSRFFLIPIYNFFKSSFSFKNVGYLAKNDSMKPVINTYFNDDKKDVIFYHLMNDRIFKNADGFLFSNNIDGMGFQDNTERELKRFVTIALSLSNKKPSSIHFSIAETLDLCLFFEDDSKIVTPLINSILPPIVSGTYILFDKEKNEEWHEMFEKLKEEDQERIDICIHLLNNSFCNKKSKKFSEICQGIDGLFGIDRKVQKTVNGNLRNIIEIYDGDKTFLEKIDKLWELRNIVIHGGVKNIKDSDKYLKYQLKYSTCPEEDYLDLSFFCIKNSVNYFYTGNFKDFKEPTNDNKFKSYLKNKFRQLNNWIQKN